MQRQCTCLAYAIVPKHCMGCAEASILPDQEIIVVNTHEHDDEDLASFFGGSGTSRAPPESGFRGTALSDHSATLQAQLAAGL